MSALAAGRKPVSYVSIESGYGHDAFLLEVDRLGAVFKNFLSSLSRTCKPVFSTDEKRILRRILLEQPDLEPETVEALYGTSCRRTSRSPPARSRRAAGTTR